MLCVILFLLLATVQGQNPPIPKMDEHRCLGSAWVVDRTRFRYSSNPVSKPSLMLVNGQYVYAFKTGIREGQTVHILAELDGGIKDLGRMEFNFLAGTPVIEDGTGADVMHLKFIRSKQILPPRTRPANDLYITANTLKNGKWMDQINMVRRFNGKYLFPLTITALADRFEIRAFGEFFFYYYYRLPLDYISFVNARGSDSRLNQIYIGGQRMEPPLRAVFPNGGIKPGFTLIIDGVARNSDFSIAFTDPENKFGIMLEIRVNFSKQTVILNSKIGKRWGQAVRGSYFPFKDKKAFDMEIRFFEKTLTVFVDTKEVATFDHRALPTYGEMSVEGLLHIRGITICEPQQWPKHAGDMYSGLLTKQTYSYSKDDS